MKLGRWMSSLVFLAGAALVVCLPALAQDGEKWKWLAFEKGKTWYQKLETDTTQVMKVMGQEVKQNQKQAFVIEWTGLEPTKDGDIVVSQKIKAVDMKIDIGGVNIAYNSEDKEKQPNNPMTDFFKKLVDAEIKLTIDPKTMKVKNVEGHDELVKKLGATNPQLEPLLKNILNKDALISMAEPTWGAFPAEAVKKGGTWEKKSTLDLGPIGAYETTSKYTYEGADKGGEKVKIDTSLTYAAPKSNQGLPFTIKTASLKSKSSSGSAIFDKAKGRFESSTMDMKIEGTLTIDVGGMETQVELNQDQKATVTSYDQNPLKK